MKKVRRLLYYTLGTIIILLAFGFIPINGRPIGCSFNFVIGLYDCPDILTTVDLDPAEDPSIETTAEPNILITSTPSEEELLPEETQEPPLESLNNDVEQ